MNRNGGSASWSPSLYRKKTLVIVTNDLLASDSGLSIHPVRS